MSSDCYAILGVTPTAEAVVISAAYRALMRHYHPDTNRDPEAQARAQAITAAYAVLRDPAKRAEYDAHRASGDLWSPEEWAEHRIQRPPAMRSVGIASAVFALGLVAAVWTLAEKDQPAMRTGHPQSAKQEPANPAPRPIYDAVQLAPESERLARLREEAEILSPAPSPPPTGEVVPPDPVVSAEPRVRPRIVAQARTPMVVSGRATPPAAPRPVTSRPALNHAETKPKTPPVAAAPKDERVAALSKMAASFSTQSMAHASDAKKNLLLGVRNRSAAKRKACASDSCVADALVRQIRETSAIVEGRAGPPK